jgi:alkanesulfonate monooxygenase SsuD/methylene tetrahydromethanopterin reductase-like flavin-dependent oxidoreductase (luciferase family)
MSSTSKVRCGIGTAPQQVSYDDIVRIWREADGLPQIEHAWLFDHLLPIAGDSTGPVFEGWTLLSAMAAQTRRLRLGLLVTSNRFRPPAMLAKIATTVDIVSGGRLDFGIGAGSRPSMPTARREYDAHGIEYRDFGDSVAALDEAITLIKRLWTEPEPFDFAGDLVRVTGAFGNPKPLQTPHPPIMIGGRAKQTLRVVARHADLWNIAGVDLEDAVARSWTTTAAKSDAIRTRSRAPCTCRCPTKSRMPPGTGSPGQSRPVSPIWFSACPARIGRVSRSGWPTRSSPRQECDQPPCRCRALPWRAWRLLPSTP